MKRLLNYQLEFKKNGHHYWVDGKEKNSLTQVIKPLYDFEGVPAKVLADAGKRGDELHFMSHLYFKGTLDESTLWEPYRPILEGLKEWKADNVLDGDKIVSEDRLYHPGWDVCCTPDLFLARGDIYEFKFGNWDEKTVGPQTAGQAGFIRVNYGIENQRRFALYPEKSGKFKSYLLKDRNDERVWLKYLDFYKFHKLFTGRAPWK